MYLVEGPDGDKLEDRFSMESAEEEKQAEEDENIVNTFDEFGSRWYFFLYPRLYLEPFWIQ